MEAQNDWLAFDICVPVGNVLARGVVMSRRLLILDTSSNCLDMALRAKMAVTIVCKQCGSTERTGYGRCKPCRQATDKKSSAKYYLAHKEARLASGKAYGVAHPEVRKRATKTYYEKNAATVNAANKRWREANPEKEAARQVRYAQANKDVICAITARRRSRKANATPAWANEFFISEAYDIAEKRSFATGIKWHVDHIVPLQGKTVCGLHVEHNLQVIPATENFQKGNRYWPEMPK